MALISEDRIDLLEEKLRAKVDTMTGFSDVEGKSRALEKVSRRRSPPRVEAICASCLSDDAAKLSLAPHRNVQQEIFSIPVHFQ